MDMAKRFTDTELWKKQRWFRKMKPEFKLAFCYIKDMCNHAGVWKIDCTDLIEDTGLQSFNINEFVSVVNTEYNAITGKPEIRERIMIIKNNLLITGFIQFQYEGKNGIVNPEVKSVKSAFQILDGLGVLSSNLSKGLIRVMDTSEQSDTVKDKDKDKDKDNKEKVSHDPRNSKLTFKYNSAEFIDRWNKLLLKPKWKKKNAETLQRRLNELNPFPEAYAIQILIEAFDRDWQGLINDGTEGKFNKWKKQNIAHAATDYSKDFRGN